MSDDRAELELLAEIAILIRKYGTETFADLANELKNASVQENLVSILKESADAVKEHPVDFPEKKRRTSPRIREQIEAIKSSEPERFDVLIEMLHQVENRALLPNLKDIREFSEDVGLGKISAKSRPDAVRSLFRQLKDVPLAKLIEMKTMAEGHLERSDRELSGWAGLILDRDGSRDQQE